MLFYGFLKNGIEVILKENHFSSAVAIQCWVKTGPLYEKASERGIAHFIEHMLFKGTHSRPLGEIASVVEACGGDINAYTTFDYTVFYLTLPSKHVKTGIDILSDAIFSSAFDPGEFAREKEVVLEEIKRANDDPSSKLGRKIFELCYKGTEASRPIIGWEKDVKSFTREKVLKFYDQWYRPRNSSLVVVGNFETAEVKSMIEKDFGRIKDRPVPTRETPNRTFPKNISTEIIKGDFKQPRLALAFQAPILEHHDCVGLDLAAFALGSGEASRFNRRLRDKEHIVTSVGTALFSPKFGGVLEVHAFLNEDSFLDGLQGLAREIMRIKYHEPINTEELSRARANLKADRIYREETVEGQARTLGLSLTTTYKHLFEDVYWTIISHSNIDTTQGAINRWIDEERVIIAGLLPKESKIKKKDLEQAFRRGIAEGKKTASLNSIKSGAKTSAKKTSTGLSQTQNSLNSQLLTLGPGKKLAYRHNPDGKLFSMIAVTEGGLRGESSSNAGLYNALGGLIAGASTKYNYEELAKIIEGFGSNLEGFSGKDSFGFEVQCLAEYTTELIPLFTSVLMEPVFPENQWKSLQREIKESLLAEDDSPASHCMRKLREGIFNEHPYRYSRLGLLDTVKEFNCAMLMQKFIEIRDSGEWVFGAVGPMPAQEVQAILQKALDMFQPKPIKRTFASDLLRKMQPSDDIKARCIKVKKDREQTHIALAFPGVSWHDPDRAALDVLVTILGGHGGRLFRNLRDRDSLAYAVSPIVSYGCSAGLIGAYIACAPSKAEKALLSLRKETSLISETAPKKSELDRAKNYIVGNHEMEMQRSDSQAMTMALMELYGIGFEDFLKYPTLIDRVSCNDVVNVARRLFRDELSYVSIVGTA